MDCSPTEVLKSINVENTEDCLKKLEFIIQNTNFVIVETSILENLLRLKNEHVLALTAQIIAELAKSSENRKLLTKNEIIRPILESCRSARNVETCLQSFRAISNINYENEDAREIVGTEGVKLLINAIQDAMENISLTNPQIPLVMSGCLLNVLMLNDDLQKFALNCNILGVIEKILTKISTDLRSQENCISYILQILSDSVDHMVDYWISENLCALLVNILKEFEKHEISVLVLEILRVESEHDEVKLCLAKQGFCELVYELVEKYKCHANDEESRAVLKMACDLIVLILTGDASMVFLYGDSEGEAFQQMVSWLDSDDFDLLTTAVLAIGNFARNDSHCIYMVDCGIAKKLLEILSKCNTSEENDIKLQYVLLSAFKHLSIPSQNKKKLIDANIIEVLYSMISTDYPPVVFKLMGTFRMLSDGQEKVALNLITKKEFVEKIVHWCYNSNHLGIHSEAPRLLAWLIKNCHSTKFIPMFVAVPDTIKCLTEMITSSFSVMQNEAFVALAIIYSYCMNMQNNETNDNSITYDQTETESNSLDNESKNVRHLCVNAIIKAEIGKALSFIIKKSYEKMDSETVNNLMRLLEELIKSEEIFRHLKNSHLDEALLLLGKNENVSDLSEKINSLALSCK